MAEKINVTEVLNTFDTAMNELEKGLQPELLTEKERLTIDKELDDVIRLALKVKLQYQQGKIERLIQSLEEDKELDLVQMQMMSNELENILKQNDKAA
jgi:hypothetical protein